MENANAPVISICFDCKNARADRCEWVSDLKKVWTKAVQVKLESLHGPEEYVWRVIECPNFEKEPERKYYPTLEDLLWIAREGYEEEGADMAI